MKKWSLILMMLATGCTSPGAEEAAAPSSGPPLCSAAWQQFIERNAPTGDGQGHGPDLGSDEWKSVVEFKLGIRGNPEVPDRNSDAWCQHIDQLVRQRQATGTTPSVPAPSFDCNEIRASSTEAVICAHNDLAALDRKLAQIYAAASAKAANEHPPILKTEQRGWIKGRNDCWKADDQHACVHDAYTRRISELQARYRLVPANGPVTYACDGNPANQVVATFFDTQPPTLIAERGDSVSLMFLQPSASGSKYAGRNESLWEHQGEAMITWGYGAPEMRCQKMPR